jgi:integrase
MASITNEKNGTKRLQYTDLDGERKAIRLGKISKKDAHTVMLRVEELLACKICNTTPARNTLVWVASISTKLRTKLAHHKLIDIGYLPTKKKKTSVQEFLNSYIEKRSKGRKPATAVVWTQVINSLVEHLPTGIAVQDVTAGHAVDWLDKLREEKYALTTIHKRISFARQFFGYAVSHKLIKENPFLAISITRPKTKSNVEVSRADITSVLAVCDPTWKAIVSLSRFGGLRCPSEVLTLKWSDVDFTIGKMTITAPKNQHHEGGGIRICPLFPEVREAIETLPRVDEYVIDKPAYRKAADTVKGWANANLRTQLLKHLEAAEVKPWPRLFHSMRASRQTEIEQEFGLPAACAWLGNTEKVAKENYLMVFEADWKKAIHFSPKGMN